jgi:hypothetical protein
MRAVQLARCCLRALTFGSTHDTRSGVVVRRRNDARAREGEHAHNDARAREGKHAHG